MSQTNIDYLFQVVAPSADRTPSSARSGDDATGFGNHLNQASASTFDAPRSPSRNNTAAEGLSSTDRSAPSRSGANDSDDYAKLSNQATSSRETSVDASTTPSSCTPICEAAGEPTNSSDGTHEEHGVADKGDNPEVTVLAAAAQVAIKEAAAKSTTSPALVERDGTALAKQDTKSANALKAQATSAKTNEESEKTHAREAEARATTDSVATVEKKLGAIAVDVDSQAEPAGEKSEHVKGSKHQKYDNNSPATRAAKEATQNGKQASKRKIVTDESAQTAADATAKSAENAETNGNAAATAPSTSTEAEEPSDDEPRRGAKTTSRVNARGDGGPSVNKSGATSVASATVAAVADTSDKGDASNDVKDQAVKPIASKDTFAAGPLSRTARGPTQLSGSGHSKNANETPRVDPARFVGRVTKAFQTAQERGGTLQLRLSPPELGSLKLQLTVKDGVMSAALETDNANARRVLLDHLPALRDRLAEQNIRVERFDVDVRHENSSGQANPRGNNQNPYQQPQQPEPRRAANMQHRPTETVATAPQPAAPRISNTEINLVI